MKTHRDAFPDQYTHALCGHMVRVLHEGKEIARGRVERVMRSRWGDIVALEDFDKTETGWLAQNCEVIP
jgi:hypothetical protein